MHLCGDATHHFKFLRDTLNVQGFDTGFPVRHGELRAELGPHVTINGGPSVPFLCSHGPQEVEAETRRILESGVTEGGRFVLREGNNLPPEAPLENVLAMVRANRRWGRYA
jgi:uroporphyrinogen-III decarboxylase